MALKIAVLKNFLKTSTSPYVVRSDSSEVVEYDQFVELMAGGRTALSKIEILGAMQLYREELQKQLVAGRTVKTPTGSFYMSASGSMETLDDSYLPNDQTNNHEVRLHHKTEGAFEDSIRASLAIVREEKPKLGIPNPLEVLAAGEDSGLIRSGGMVRIKGLRLRFDRKDATQGVFFADAAGVELRSSFYPLILPGSVLASVPDTLAAGTYAVVVRAAVNGKDITMGRIEGVTISA
jgi:hypothetical protein